MEYMLDTKRWTNTLTSSLLLPSTPRSNRRLPLRKLNSPMVFWVANCPSTLPVDSACNLPAPPVALVVRQASRILSRIPSPLQTAGRSSVHHRHQLRFFAGGLI
jgi:hypothetical protein